MDIHTGGVRYPDSVLFLNGYCKSYDFSVGVFLQDMFVGFYLRIIFIIIM